ncbi:hypothetical protein BDV96DRAFT_591457 [Lophiotrema nucula]|uniref:Retinol dehydrogenase 12 n=1 Tax=Lophiotrema nucula TaxID=690887 RepID=A0A6A5YGP3_9PLEO|nr:hypothetical protein BDV96DRAFT_591457 [Lophiotrema nucula]
MSTPMGGGQFFLMLMKSQFFVKIPLPTSDFTGQTVIVTGSNTGLGLEAARHLVRLGAAKVILAVRSVDKGERAAESILKSTEKTKNVIEVWQLDLGNYESIRAFGKRVGGLERLDAVIQNAGINTLEWSTAEDNETTLTVNVVGAVLVGLLVLPKLRESGKKFGTKNRLTFVGSDLHYVGSVKEAKQAGSGSLFDALNKKQNRKLFDRYPTTKLLLLYAVREIARRSPVTPESPVIISCMTPGACKSDLMRDEIPKIVRIIIQSIMGLMMRSTEVGGGMLVDAVRPDRGIEETHGAFLQDLKVFPNGPNVESAKGQDLAKRFNEELFAKLETISPGSTGVLQ